jgi:hypothetical protein
VSAAYHILDEPRGSRTSALIVNPFWPLLGLMLAGAWLGALLFALNAWLLRGPSWFRELALSVAILAGSPLIFLGLVVMDNHGWLPAGSAQYALLLIVVWKLCVAYWIFFLQQTAFSLHEYFSAHTQTRSIPAGAAMVAAGTVLKAGVVNAIASPLWKIMVN